MHTAQLMPLPLTVSCFSKIQIGFTFLVPAHPGSPGKRAVKRVCVCVCMRACVCVPPVCVCVCVRKQHHAVWQTWAVAHCQCTQLAEHKLVINVLHLLHMAVCPNITTQHDLSGYSGVFFWYRLTQVVPDKGSINGCVCFKFTVVQNPDMTVLQA